MSGYRGYSMSNNALKARERLEWPKSEFIKIGCPRIVFEGLKPDSWHHTSKMYNRTEFYSFDRVIERGLSMRFDEHFPRKAFQRFLNRMNKKVKAERRAEFLRKERERMRRNLVCKGPAQKKTMSVRDFQKLLRETLGFDVTLAALSRHTRAGINFQEIIKLLQSTRRGDEINTLLTGTHDAIK